MAPCARCTEFSKYGERHESHGRSAACRFRAPPAPIRTIGMHTSQTVLSKSEPILEESLGRFTMFPVQYDSVWKMYKQSVASFWVPEELDFAQDIKDFAKLKPDEQRFIKMILAFFAGADGIVIENLAARFLREVQIPELRAFYAFQIAIENIHSETYSLMIKTLVQDPSEAGKLFRAIEDIPCIQAKADWARKWICSDTSTFAMRLVAFAVVEGIFFSGAFCSIFWLKKRGLMPGLSTANAFIARDEAKHTELAVHVYRDLLANKLDEDQVSEIVCDAVNVETDFICDSLPCAMIGINADSMMQYIKFVADWLMVSLGHKKIYSAENPFSFMEQISLQGKSNFFELRESSYQKSNVMSSLVGDSARTFTVDADF